ncbi:MAG: hypothetical protein U0610_20630 [bacterium]
MAPPIGTERSQEPSADARSARALSWLLGGATVVATLGLLAWLAATVRATQVPFDEDEAAHARAAFDVWRAATHASVGELGAAIARQGFYPPLHSLLVAVSYGIAGPTLAASRLPSVLLLAFAAGALAVAAWRVEKECAPANATRSHGPIAGGWIVALSAFATSPIGVGNAVLCMLEPLALAGLGVLLIVLTGFERRAVREPEAARESLGWAGLGLLVGVIGLGTKYSFAVIEIAALALAVATEPAALSMARRVARRLAAVLLPPLLVLGAWLMITDPAQVGYFFFGHPSYAPLFSRANLLFFPRAWLHEYFVSPLVGCVVAVLAAVGARTSWRSLTVRASAFVIVTSWALLTLSTTDESRHAILVVPAAALLAGRGVRALGERLGGTEGRVSTSATAPLVLWAALMASAATPWAVALPAAVRAALEGAPELDALARFASRRVDPEQPMLANGLFDQLGVDGLAWRIASDRGGAIATRQVRIARYPVEPELASMAARRGFGVDPLWADRALAGASFDDVAASGRYRHVVQLVDRLGELPNPSWEDVARVCRSRRVGRLDLGRWILIVADLGANDGRAPR